MLSTVICDDRGGRDGRGREVQEGEKIYIHIYISDSLCSVAETNTNLWSNYIKKKKVAGVLGCDWLFVANCSLRGSSVHGSFPVKKTGVQVGCMRKVLGPGALGGPGGSGWGRRWEGGSGWGRHVNPRPFHFNVWQNSLQIKKKKKKKKKKENWSGLPCPSLRDLPNPRIEPMSLTSPALAGGFFATS